MHNVIRALGILSLLSLAQCASRTAPAQPRTSTAHPAAAEEDPCLLFGPGYSFTIGPPPAPLTVAAHGELALGDGTMAPVWEYAHAPSQRYELMAFAAYDEAVIYIALDAPTREQLAAMERSFTELVHSVHFLTANVDVKR